MEAIRDVTVVKLKREGNVACFTLRADQYHILWTNATKNTIVAGNKDTNTLFDHQSSPAEVGVRSEDTYPPSFLRRSARSDARALDRWEWICAVLVA